MKKIIIILLIAVAAFFISPYFVGKIAESETPKVLDALNSHAKYGTHKLVNYERGFRSSTAQFSFASPMIEGLAGTESVLYNCDIKHQMSGADYRCKLDQSGPYGEFVKSNLDGKDPLSFGAEVSALGGVNYQVDVEPFSSKDPNSQDNVLDFKELALNISTDLTFSKISYEGNFDGLTVDGLKPNGEKQKMTIGEVEIEGDASKVTNLLYLGDTTINIDSANITTPAGEEKWNDLTFFTETKSKGDTISADTKITVDSISSAALDQGDIENMEMNINLKGINREALEAYLTEVERLQNATENEIQQQMMGMVPLLEQLFVKGLAINFENSAKVMGDDNEINVNLELVDSFTMADSMMFMFAPEEALKKIELKLSSKLSETLINKLPQAASAIQNSAIFEKDGSDYELDLELGKEISLNGKTMTAAELQALAMSAAMQ